MINIYLFKIDVRLLANVVSITINIKSRRESKNATRTSMKTIENTCHPGISALPPPDSDLRSKPRHFDADLGLGCGPIVDVMLVWQL